MRTSVVIAALVALGTGVLCWSRWNPDYDADFVIHVHDDSSVDWALLIPQNTLHAIERQIEDENARVVDSSAMGEEVLKLVGRGFGKRGLNADRCRVVSHASQGDGSTRYDGHCSWTDAPVGHRV